MKNKNREHKYILEGRKIIPEPDIRKWSEWFEHSSAIRIAGRNFIGSTMVSTVFFGIDHNFIGKGKPVLFETVVFNSRGKGNTQARYSTFSEAAKGHNIFVKKMLKNEKRN